MVGCVRRAGTRQRADTLRGHNRGQRGQSEHKGTRSGLESTQIYQRQHYRHHCGKRGRIRNECGSCQKAGRNCKQIKITGQQRGGRCHVCEITKINRERQDGRGRRHECPHSEAAGPKFGPSDHSALKCGQSRHECVQSDNNRRVCIKSERNHSGVQGNAARCGQFWKRGRFLLIFLLSLMSVRGSRCSVPLGAGAQLVCARSPGLTERQRAMCRAAPAAMPALGDGLRLAYAECAAQMRGRRWNCSGVSDGKHFGHVISKGTKEAAYTYAITSAGVTHALSAACARGDLPACPCDNRRRAGTPEQWQWGGGGGGGAGAARCAGDAAHGARFARRFLDARELEHDARALMNLHNNRLGRKLVKELVSKECKCHGVSGSCAVRTCWRALPPFRRVARALTDKYLRAKQVAAYERGTTVDGRVNLQLVIKKPQKPTSMSRVPRKSELVYLEPSPPYCEPDPAHAAAGTHQRHCNHTSRGEDGCEHLCCGRGYSTLRLTSRAQCRCRFQWCCKVHCETCLLNTEHHICN